MTSSILKKIIDEHEKYLFQNYQKLPVSFIRGDGSYLYDQNNKKYIDLFSGIAVCNIGYNNKAYTKALHNQINNIIHSSNWFYNKEQIHAAKLISELSFPGKTLFVNSGTEANEAAIKLARRYGLCKNKKTFQIITFTNSFHGRTFGSMTATAQEKFHDGFGPLVPGFKYLPFNDIAAFQKEIKKNNKIAAILIELIQGEGGIHVADKEFIKEIFYLCNKKDILTIIDEVQTGIGRTGNIFAYQHYNIVPDIITLAKGLGGGVPIGAIHVKNHLSEYLGKGKHASSFGGNHLACAAAIAVLNEIKKKNLLNNISKVSSYIFESLDAIKNKVTIINDIRGIGLHIGVELNKPGFDIVKKALSKGLIINYTAEKVLRITPPLNISLSTVKSGMKILEQILLEENTH